MVKLLISERGNPRYICMYACIVFPVVCSHVRLRITLTARRTTHLTRVGVALTIDKIFAQTIPLRRVVLHICRGRKGNKLKRRREREREARQNE